MIVSWYSRFYSAANIFANDIATGREDDAESDKWKRNPVSATRQFTSIRKCRVLLSEWARGTGECQRIRLILPCNPLSAMYGRPQCVICTVTPFRFTVAFPRHILYRLQNPHFAFDRDFGDGKAYVVFRNVN